MTIQGIWEAAPSFHGGGIGSIGGSGIFFFIFFDRNR
jgi:hypothetical protein